MESSSNLYEILGISQNATPEEIKKAYHKLAIKYHPDRNTDENATQKFQELSRAYSILSDPEKRRRYDMTGSIDETKININPFMAMFNVFFTQSDSDYELGVEYEDFIYGKERIVNISEMIWVDLDGNPAKMEPCLNCRQQNGLSMLFSGMCRACNGNKIVPAPGSIQTKKNIQYEIKIPPESWPGRILEFGGKKFKIMPLKKENLYHEHYDLIYVHKINIFDALLAEPQIIDVVRRKYRVTFSHPINPDTKVVYENKGLRSPNGRQGALVILFDILFPTKLSEKERAALVSITT